MKMKIMLTNLFLCLLFITIDCSYSPLMSVRDNYMSAYLISMMCTLDSGAYNNSFALPHFDLNATSINYKLFISTSYGTDYTIINNTISLSNQINKKNLTSISISFYTLYQQGYNSADTTIQVLLLDVMSPSYPYIMPSILRIINLTLMSTFHDQFINVSTFNPVDLNLSNDLAIYSFIAGFQIVSQNQEFQFALDSQIINETTIRVRVSSIANLNSVDLVRIDTVVIDKAGITFSKLLVLDFQTSDCPTDSYVINYAYMNYPYQIRNKFLGLSHFTLLNKTHYKFNVQTNYTSSLPIIVYSAYNFTRIIFTHLSFIMKQCPSGFPFFDKSMEQCSDTNCSSRFYLDPIQQQCLPCVYACKACNNDINCTSCSSLVDFRILDSNSSMCIPKDGYYDDGTNNSIAQKCNSSCKTCFGEANNCTTCLNTAYFLDTTTMKCVLCSSTLNKCLSCTNSITCTQMCLYFCQTCDTNTNCASCSSSDFRVLDLNTSFCIPIDGYYDDGTNNSIALPCQYTCWTCDNSVNCISCDSLIDFRILDTNTSLCIPIDGYYDDGTNNSIAKKCNSSCRNCFGNADNCTSCLSTAYFLNTTNNKCVFCSSVLTRCLSCIDSSTCTQFCLYFCQTCDTNLTCISCSSSDFRVLDLNTSLCIPMDGYFDDGTNNTAAQKCDSICQKCFGGAKKCTSCLNSSYYLELSLSTCILCSGFNFGCLSCLAQANQISCLTCDTNSNFILDNNSLCTCKNNSFFHNLTLNCQICTNFIQGCIDCLSEIQCTVCSPYFYISNLTNTTICQQICGDGVLYNLECDDGNLINGDGCSSICQIEQFYTCYGGSSISKSICVYNSNYIGVKIISFLKDVSKNTIYLRFEVKTSINITNVDLNGLFLPSFLYQKVQTTYDNSLNQYLCKINYNESLNSYDHLSLTFKLPTTSNSSFSLNHTIALNSQTDNNLALKVYSSQMYSQLKSLNNSSQILVYLYTVICLFAWITGQQLYSLQLFFILQYAYLGLLKIDRLQLSMTSLKQFGLTFGIFDINNLDKGNNQFSTFLNNQLPIRIKSLGFFESLLLNINFSFVIVIAMIVVGILIYFIGMRLELLRWQIQGKNMFFWWVFYWLIMIQIPAMTSILLTFKHENSSSLNFGADISVSIIYLIFLVSICIYLLIFKSPTQQFKLKSLNNQNSQQTIPKASNFQLLNKKSFTSTKMLQSYFFQATKEQKQNHPVSYLLKSNFYLFVMVYRLLIVLTVIFLNDYEQFNAFCLILDVLMLLLICILRPYKVNLRPIVNSSIILVLEGLYTYKKYVNKQSDVSFFSLDAVIILIVLLYLTFALNVYFIFKEIFQNLMNCFQFSRQKQQKQKQRTKSKNLNSTNQNNKTNQTLQDLIIHEKDSKSKLRDFVNVQQLKQVQYEFEKLEFQQEEMEIQKEIKIQKQNRRKAHKKQLINNKNQQNSIQPITQYKIQQNYLHLHINLQKNLNLNLNLNNQQEIQKNQYQFNQNQENQESFSFYFEKQEENNYQKSRRRKHKKNVRMQALKRSQQKNLQTIKISPKTTQKEKHQQSSEYQKNQNYQSTNTNIHDNDNDNDNEAKQHDFFQQQNNKQIIFDLSKIQYEAHFQQ